MDLQTLWFGLIGILLIGYAVLDGFDLGVGVLSMFARDQREKRIAMRAIGPVWDGNEVWLLAAGGSLFAAFPPVYATVFSGFYIALTLLLAALILRAVALEFYSKVESGWWRRLWAWSFGVSSLLTAVLLGVAFGNILRGLPLNVHGDFAGTFRSLLNPYALLVGVLTLVVFIMHGAAFLSAKTDGDLQKRMEGWAFASWVVFGSLYIFATVATMLTSPFLFAGLLRRPMFYALLALLVVGIAAFPAAMRAGRRRLAFTASGAILAGMLGMAGVSLYPNIVYNTLNAPSHLTIYNASSTPRTLLVMAIVAAIGVPLVLLYTGYVYWVFKGKVEDEEY